MAGSYIVAGARTPIGKLSGALASLTAADLGAIAIRGALERAGVAPDAVEYVVMGQVIMSGTGQVPARQAAVAAGIPKNVPSANINKVCLSGLNAIYLADQMIANGEADIVVAGGMESMTNAPFILPGARAGFRYGDVVLKDAIDADALWCSFDACLMGASTERYNGGSFTREQQDDFAMKSNQRAAAAAAKLAEEIVPVTIPQRKGDPIVVSADQGVRPDTTMDTLANLKPAFDKSGTITAANASQLSDGASAVVVMSARAVEQYGVHPLGQVVSYGMVAGPDTVSLLNQPSRAALRALEKADMKVGDVDLFEINEAFAAVGLSSMAELGITDEITNVNGGAIALGHPVGMSGNRLALTLLHELRRRGGGVGVATLCGGGGQGDAIVVRTV
jgi:acetyl-CoA C-acetyltransferase